MRSVGYSAIPIRGLPFDGVRGVIPSQSGRVLQSDGAILPGLYVTGWIKRGPSGIIGSNIADAQETISSLIADLTTAKNDEIRERLWRRKISSIRQCGRRSMRMKGSAASACRNPAKNTPIAPRF